MPSNSPQPNKFSGWTDREIYGLAEDRLQFDHYASVLAEIIQEADTPLTLGVFGPWGSGKTSLMRLIKDTLDKSTAKTRFRTVWFDAWTFDKEDALWRALLLLVLRAVRKDVPKEDNKALKKLDDLEASLYRDVDRAELGGVTIDWEKAVKGTVSGLTRLTVSLVPGVGTFLAKTAEEAESQLSGGTLDSLFEAVQRKRQEIHRDHVESLEKFQEGFAELLRDHFVGQGQRLAVFIDDLDRCLPEKAISVLEAIKLFIDAPGCVYVIGTDRDVIEQGIRVKYKDFFVGEAKAIPITGDSYLEKIIQIPFHLPPLQEKRIEDFIAQYDESVPPDCAAIFAAGMQLNPRKVKRIINVFRLLRKLAEVRVAEKEIDQFDAGLLAKIVVIQSRWRELYADLQEYPNLIQDLEQHFHAAPKKAEAESRSGRDKPEIPLQEVAAVGDAVARDRPVTGEEKMGTPTLLQKYAAFKSLGQMLRLPPYFEALKIDQIQLYLYMTHTVAAEADKEKEAGNVEERRWQDLLSNDFTRLRAVCDLIGAENRANAYKPALLSVIAGKTTSASVLQRVSAGNALAYLGDSRFREGAWYLPDDPMLGFVEIPAGPFLMGSDPKHDPVATESEQPQHEVNLPIYYIARYPVTVAQFQTFVTASAYQPQDEDSLRGLPNHPVVSVSWYEALKYCEWLSDTLKNWKGIPQPLAEKLRMNGWRIILPSEAEWEKAARGVFPSPPSGEGPGVRVYPWGDEFDPDRANVAETGTGTTSAVGCFPAGASPYGLLDMSGNVWEWCATKWQSGYQDYANNNNLSGKGTRVLRGGSWSYTQVSARCASRLDYPPGFRDDDLGFRVCVSPRLLQLNP